MITEAALTSRKEMNITSCEGQGRVFWLLAAAFSLLTAGIVLFSTSPLGVGLSPDSVNYIAAARNLVAGQGYTSYDGTQISLWPPFYPALLGLLQELLHADALPVARYLNSALSGLTVFLSGIWGLFLSKERGLALVVAALISLAYPLISVSVMAWTEPLFILLTTLFLMAISFYLITSRTHFLALAIGCALLTTFTRYIGIALAVSGMIAILLFATTSLRVKTAAALLLGLSNLTAIGLWLIRNKWLTGTFMGPRNPSPFTWGQNSDLAVKTITGWFLPTFAQNIRFLSLSLAALILLALPALLLQRRYASLSLARAASFIKPAVVFVGVYLAFLLISSTTTAYDPINDRLLSPVYIPLIIVFSFIGLQAWFLLKRRFSNRIVHGLIAIALGLVFVLALGSLFSFVRITRQNGLAFASRAWEESETRQYLLVHPQAAEGVVIYSNAPEVLYLSLDIPANFIPARSGINTTGISGELAELEGSWPESKALFVWFDLASWRTYLYTPEELGTITTLSRIASPADGEIMLVSPAE
jgi:hypothetical protein